MRPEKLSNILPLANPSLTSISVLFAFSFFVTAFFSASLKVFFPGASWRVLLGKGLLIPCFTWTVQLLLSVICLRGGRRRLYWQQLGGVCLAGSAALLPAALYNTVSVQPSPVVSAVNVLLSVLVMAALHYRQLRRHQFKTYWAVVWVALIVVNMSLYVYSIS